MKVYHGSKAIFRFKDMDGKWQEFPLQNISYNPCGDMLFCQCADCKAKPERWIVDNVKVRWDNGEFHRLPLGTEIVYYEGKPSPGRITKLRLVWPGKGPKRQIEIDRMDILS